MTKHQFSLSASAIFSERPPGHFQGPMLCSFSGSYSLFGVSTRTCVHALMFKTHYFSHTVHCFSISIHPLSEHSVLAPVSSSDWPTSQKPPGGAAASCYKAESKCGDRCGSLITVQHTHRFWCGEVLC